MSTRGVGVDLVDVARFRLALERHPRLVERLFTAGEQRDARSRPERLAARFAAKEAVLKTLKVGVGATTWRSIEVTTDDAGAPSVVLHGTAHGLARAAGVTSLHLSMTHTDVTACAFVVGSSASGESSAR
ncbi:MAG TPA: holo-ACP synthase [Acidimicrobiales bacterium]|nr:holo-ACP synthase [Acidimicrobiales bacterium]